MKWEVLKGKVKNILQKDSDEPSRFTLKRRLTERELIKKTANELRLAEEQFLKSVEECINVYHENIYACKKMDDVLGKN